MKRLAVSVLAGVAACSDPISTDLATQSGARHDSIDRNPYGINAHAARDELLHPMLDIGIGWYRVDCEWKVNEPRDGELDFSLTDRLVDTITSRGGSVILTVAYTPSWANGGSGDGALPPRDPARFVSFVRETARRYRGRIGCIGIWNEPNLREFWKGSKSQYIDTILVPSLRAVREEAPEVITCGPDLSSAGDERRDWMDPILASAGDLLDVITHHQYDGDDTVSGRVREIEAMRELLVRRGHGDKPLWITETGWDSPRFSRATQSNNLRGLMSAMLARPWWAKTIWYDSHGGGWGLYDGEAGNKTESFHAYADFIEQRPPETRPAPGPNAPPEPPQTDTPPPSPEPQPTPEPPPTDPPPPPEPAPTPEPPPTDTPPPETPPPPPPPPEPTPPPPPEPPPPPPETPPPPPPSSACDPATQPAPHYAERDGQCLPSCGVLGGTASFGEPCELHGLIDAGLSYDAGYCCKDPPPICDPVTQPPPHFGARDGVCRPSCGGLGGTASFDEPCESHGLEDRGIAYDVAYCCG